MRLHLMLPTALLALALPVHAATPRDSAPERQSSSVQVHVLEIDAREDASGTAAPALVVQREGTARLPQATLEQDPTLDGPPPTVTLSFRGTLKDAVREIARQSGVSVVATSKLDTPVELHLNNVPASAALRTLARVHGLELQTSHDDGVRQFILSAQDEAAPTSSLRLHVPPPPPPRWPSPPEPFEPSPHLDAWLDHFDEGAGADDDAASGKKSKRRFVVPVQRVQDVMVFARSRTVDADDEVGDVLVTGGSLTLDGRARGDVVVVGGNVDLNGEAMRDAVVIGGNLNVMGTVRGDVQVIGGQLTLGQDADIHGGVEALGGNVRREEGAKVRGAVVNGPRGKSKFQAEDDEAAEDASIDLGGRSGFLDWLGKLVTRFAILFGLGFLFLMLVPERVRKLGQEMRQNTLADGTTGFVGLLALGPLLLLLCITLVGIPVALLLVLLLPLGLVMGATAIAHEIGVRMPVRWTFKTQAGVLALGLLPLVFLSTVPVLGFLLILVLSTLSLGALVRTRFGGRAAGERPGSSEMPTSL